MKFAVVNLVVWACCLCACGKQTMQQPDISVKFDTIIRYFKTRNYTNDTIREPFIHQNRNFKIEISNKPVTLALQELILKNPIDSTYPMCYSVVYQSRLISLFEPGTFVCHSLSSFKRDTTFERIINTRRFQYQWIADKQLIGLSDGKYYYLSSEYIWLEYTTPFPLENQPKLFEDSTYIAFCDCRGEWGGTVYFYDKRTRKVYFTDATCANTVQKKDSTYLVLSQLPHEGIYSEHKSIVYPNKLSVSDLHAIQTASKGSILGFRDTSNASKVIFNYFTIGLYSSFAYQGRTLYLTHWRDATFLAELDNGTVSIVNPLFNSTIFTIHPITTVYDTSTVINLDSYHNAEWGEVSCIIIQNNRLIKLDWNKKYGISLSNKRHKG